MPTKGIFIAIEGVDGSGKTGQAKRLYRYLMDNLAINTIYTREPGGTEVAEEIRETLLKFRDEVIEPDTELMLFFAARKQNIKNIIDPALERGDWVICDRFFESSYSYQVIGRGASEELYNQLCQHTVRRLPDLTIVIDIDERTRLERLALRQDEINRLDLDESGFHQRTRFYLKEKAEERADYRLVDGNGTQDEVFERILDTLRPLINLE